VTPYVRVPPRSLLAFWRAQDALFDRVEATWWGAVVSDARFPGLQEPNYARVETHHVIGLPEIEDALLPACAERQLPPARCHLFPEDQTDLVAQASTRGERITWDLVMVEARRRHQMAASRVEAFDDRFWRRTRTPRLFDVDEQFTVDQLQALERGCRSRAGAFVVREGGAPVAFAAVLALEGSAYLDHVVTFPAARRRGHAQALTRRALVEAAKAGADRTYLLAEPGGAAERLYARLGFERAGHLASWLAPIPR
jgi:ribosomal protein S18 acetylase RimI-like enzyme